MADSTRFQLFSFWRSSATYRVRVALNLKGIEFEEQFVDLDAGEQYDAGFLEVNPMGAIPALIENGHPPLIESLAIVEYLDDIVPEPALLPPDARGRARVRSIAEMMAADIHPFIVPRTKRYLSEHADFDDDAWHAWQKHWFTLGLQALEKRLAGDAATGAFCHGDEVSLADIFVASIVAVMKVFEIGVADIPTVDRIVARCNDMRVFADADPRKQHGAPLRLRQALHENTQTEVNHQTERSP